jgi:hypothetical protein
MLSHLITSVAARARAKFAADPFAFPSMCCVLVWARGFLSGDPQTMTTAFLLWTIAAAMGRAGVARGVPADAAEPSCPLVPSRKAERSAARN